MKKIKVADVEFIGYGKIMLNTAGQYNLPHLHILLAKDGNYISALNLEFGVVANGNDTTEAVSLLVKMLARQIKFNFDKSGFKYFEEEFANTSMEEYWGAYRLIDLELAKTEQDIGRVIINAVTTQARMELMQELGMTVDTDISMMKGAA